jgi:transcriptional regulator with XRE-family HTH domain
MTFASEIKRKRFLERLAVLLRYWPSQREIARAAGISAATISKAIHGAGVSATSLKKLERLPDHPDGAPATW